MTNKVRWGILSTANIGRKRVIPAIQQSKNGFVHAVASRSAAKAETFARDLAIPRAYGSYQALIDSPEVDAIYIPTPNSEHAEWSIRCAEAGKPTLCEKPLARDAAEAQQMVDAFAKHNVLFAEAFMYRFHPQTQHVKALLEDGAVGEIMSIHAAFTFAIQSEANIRLSRDLAGGGLMDVGCYCVNVMRLMTGEEPQTALAVARMGAESGVDECLAGVLKFPSGIIGHFDCGLRSHRTHTYEIRGTHGRIVVEEGFVMEPDSAPVIRHWRGDDYTEIKIAPANHYTLMAEDFADALINQRPPRFLPQDAANNMRVIDRLLNSLA